MLLDEPLVPESIPRMSFKVRLARSRPVKLLGRVAAKFWSYSSAYLLLCLIFYWFYGGIFAFFLLLVAVSGLLYRFQDRLVYFPEKPLHSRVYVPSPTMFNLPYQNVCTQSSDGTMLHMFFIAQPEGESKTAPTVLYFHGNAGNIGHRLHNVSGLYHNVKCNILMLEYRGYGLSQGSPSEDGLYMDAQAGIEYLANRTDINTDEIIVFGRSLGGAVAIDLATKEDNQNKIWCLILENTFTSIPEMARVLIRFKLFLYLPLFFYKNKYMSLLKIQSVTVPVLFISGQKDNLVPPQMMMDLHDRCRSSWKRWLPIPGGTHNETWHQPNYYESLSSFLTELRSSSPHARAASAFWHIQEV